MYTPSIVIDLITITGSINDVESQADAVFLDDWGELVAKSRAELEVRR